MKANEIPKFSERGFSRTNTQSIQQRASLIRLLLPKASSIAELCCGDCRNQKSIYAHELGIEKYIGVDVDPRVTHFLKSSGTNCILGDVRDQSTLKQCMDYDLIFFGPPLSKECTGHEFFSFDEVRPSYVDVLSAIFGQLNYPKTVVCICPKSTSLGAIRKLYDTLKKTADGVNLSRIHYSVSSLTGKGKPTEPRLKYVEIWFSRELPDSWDISGTRPG